MGESTKAAVSKTSVEAPGDDAQPKPRKRTNRGRRYDLFDDGEGDYRIMAIVSSQYAQDHDIPPKSYLHLPNVPGFRSTAEARKWIREHGSDLQGLQVIILRGHHIMAVEVEQTPRITVKEKARRVREEAQA